MFCPNCKCEYLPGVARCSDCDVPLVETLPEPDDRNDAEVLDAHLQPVWAGEHQSECVRICEDLHAAEIPFKVVEHSQQFLEQGGERYEIGVPAELVDRAKEVINAVDLDVTADLNDSEVMDSLGMETNLRPDAAEFDPDQSAVEVWRQKAPKDAWMIESSLRENNIDAHTEVLEDGAFRILVPPEDQERAKEIVREIEHGAPPE